MINRDRPFESAVLVAETTSEAQPGSPPASIAVARVNSLVDDSTPLERLTKTAAAAASAGQWTVVANALDELRALRHAASANVVEIDVERRGRR